MMDLIFICFDCNSVFIETELVAMSQHDGIRKVIIYTDTEIENKEILSRPIPELLNSMVPCFKPLRKQMHKWLGALHYHQ